MKSSTVPCGGRLIGGEDRDLVQNDLNFGVRSARAVPMNGFDQSVATGNGTSGTVDRVRALAGAIDLDGVNMAATLEAAMAISGPRPQLDETGEPELYRLRHPDMPEWKNVIDRSVRQPQTSRATH